MKSGFERGEIEGKNERREEGGEREREREKIKSWPTWLNHLRGSPFRW